VWVRIPPGAPINKVKQFNIMKKTLIAGIGFGLVIPIWGATFWSIYKEENVEIVEKIILSEPEKVEAHVLLTKWQIDKMASSFENDSHPSDILKFKTVVRKDGNGWRISSTHLVKAPEQYPIPKGKFIVVDSSYVDHSGDFKSCVEYASSYKEFHNYIVVSSE
jgi:hypothetical protein